MASTNPGFLFCFGLGFSANALARRLLDDGWRVAGTSRDPAGKTDGIDPRIKMHRFDREHPLPNAADAMAGATHVLVSVPPDPAGDPAFDLHADDIAALNSLEWLGYLSTTGVYGHTDGKSVDETAPLNPSSARSQRRVDAEADWQSLHAAHGIAVHVFRLAGIYGPGRSPLDTIRAGRARRISKPGHQFSRIHVDDIATILAASIANPSPGAVYNVCDDEPAAPADVVTYGCELLGVEPPPMVSFDDAKPAMSDMALTFWNDHRTVDNSRLSNDLGVTLAYPNYRAGLKAILDSGG